MMIRGRPSERQRVRALVVDVLSCTHAYQESGKSDLHTDSQLNSSAYPKIDKECTILSHFKPVDSHSSWVQNEWPTVAVLGIDNAGTLLAVVVLGKTSLQILSLLKSTFFLHEKLWQTIQRGQPQFSIAIQGKSLRRLNAQRNKGLEQLLPIKMQKE